MPRFREDLSRITAYKPGTPIEEAARELGMEDIVKLASNECPLPPFPEVQQAIATAAAMAHRYPDNDASELRAELADFLSVPKESLIFGTGSASLMMISAFALGGPGRSIAYGWPSFGLYRIAARTSFSTEIEVPLTGDHRYDLDALAAALRPDTSLVYLCNPNNPTGTYVPLAAVVDFISAVPQDVMIIVDEAYYEYVQAPDFGTALPIALERDNVLVAHTFSKVYGLAGLRVGYMVGNPATISELRRVQVPFSVNSLAQAGATEALRHPEKVADRVNANAAALKVFADELSSRGYEFAESQTNFVYMHPRNRADEFLAAMARNGIVVRPFGEGWIRVTIGTEAENARFFAALDAVA
ncbi:MAG: histidinol-phosphate transaminase [Acidimicrobiia bacterium]|nr:histidinol-phosphate transaminase [Acidimicrobiia bacterium]